MYKQLILIVCFALSATAATWSQTQARPRSKAPNVEHARHAEERSNGAAFSGRGRGGDKDLVTKHRKHKAWKHKNKLKGKKHHPAPDRGTVRKTAPYDPREMQRTPPAPTTRPAQSPTNGPKPKTAPRPRPGAPRG